VRDDRRQSRFFPHDDEMALIVEIVDRGVGSVLEFGPGASTAVLLAAGISRIVSLEYQPEFLAAARERFARTIVDLLLYENAMPVTVPGLDPAERFDLALVDSPIGSPRNRRPLPGLEDFNRLNTCVLALERAPVVLLHDARRPWERNTLAELERRGHRVTMIETGKGLARIERC